MWSCVYGVHLLQSRGGRSLERVSHHQKRQLVIGIQRCVLFSLGGRGYGSTTDGDISVLPRRPEFLSSPRLCTLKYDKMIK